MASYRRVIVYGSVTRYGPQSVVNAKWLISRRIQREATKQRGNEIAIRPHWRAVVSLRLLLKRRYACTRFAAIDGDARGQGLGLG